MLDLDSVKKAPLKVKLDGEEYQLRRPLVGEQLDIRRKAKEDGADEAEIAIDVLVFCGLPRDKALMLSDEQITALQEALFKKK